MIGWALVGCAKPAPPAPPVVTITDAIVSWPESMGPEPRTPLGDARVQIRSTGRGTIQGCSESGSTILFDGLRNFVVPASSLPATCLIAIDEAYAVFQVTGSGAIACEKQGDAIACDVTTVP